MKIFKEKIELHNWREELSQPLALVPTMGNLHEGHLSLVRQALQTHHLCMVSIFVNPLQFGQGEDFEKYPKTLESDLEKLSQLETELKKNIVVFAPSSSQQILPEHNNTVIEVKGLDSDLCGKFRPQHFSGVSTVVYHLLHNIRPNLAIFGQKDYQQFCIISKMVKDLGLPVEIAMGPIVRSKEGLALSSRNQYLSEKDKKEALKLSLTLKETIDIFKSNGLDSSKEFLEKQKHNDTRFQYLEILDADDLKPAKLKSHKLVVAGAFILGDTRLIDNCLIS